VRGAVGGSSVKYNTFGYGNSGYGRNSDVGSRGGGGALSAAPYADDKNGGLGYPATGGPNSSINEFLTALNSANNTDSTIKSKVSNGICGGGAGFDGNFAALGSAFNGGGYVTAPSTRIAPSSYGSGDCAYNYDSANASGGHQGIIVVSYVTPATDMLSGGQNTFDYGGRRYRCFTTTNDTTNVLTQTNDNSSLRIPLTSGVKTGDYCLGPGLPSTCKVNNVASDGTYTYVLLSSPIGGVSTATNAYAFISL
jgi:hypothetical protein